MQLGIDAGNKKSIDSMVIIGGLARIGACYFLNMMDVISKKLYLPCG